MIDAETAAERLRTMARERGRAINPVLSEALKMARRGAMTRYRWRGAGRRIWLTKTRGTGIPPLIIKNIKPTYDASADAYVGGLQAIGMAALIEGGGHTKPHAIKPRGGSVAGRLVFQVGGRLVFARAVRHPGSPITRTVALEPEVQAAARWAGPRVASEVAALGERLLEGR